MGILIKAAKIFDPSSEFHNHRKDIQIGSDGLITAIADTIESDSDQPIEANGALLSVGWFDMRAHFQDPGFEYKEDLESGIAVAQASGFTDVALVPNTNPVIDTKNDIAYLHKRSASYVSRLHAVAAITLGTNGEELTEMFDLHHAGAIAFSDGIHPVWHTDILLKSLQYLQQFDGLLINKPEDKWLTMFGQMNEGRSSTVLGMKGMPSLAEEIMIKRDLMLLSYAGGKIHFSGVSSAAGLDLIRAAKADGLNVTCDVPIYHLILDDSQIIDYDTNYKVSPPLRSPSDRKALIDAVLDDTIDVLVSNHSPQDSESKNLEFDLAEFGIISQQSFLPNMASLVDQIPMEKLLEKVTTGPRGVLGQSNPAIVAGEEACLTLFDPAAEWVFDAKSNKSKSCNSPWFGQKLKGKPLAVVVGDRIQSML